jgi:cobalt-zinc-cadmium efflux system membrane fusion protein
MSATNRTPPDETLDHSHLGRVGWRKSRVALLCLALGLLAGVSIGIGLGASKRASSPLPSPGLVANATGIVLTQGSPQERYIELQVAKQAPGLAPIPAPARVLVDETRAGPVFAPVAGRVEQVVVHLGQEVKPGDRLVAIRSSSLPELGREAESARAALAVKTALVERLRDLVALRAVPEKDLIVAQQEKREIELTLKAAEGKRRSLHLGRLDPSGLFWLTAPRKGTVVERAALMGMEVGPDRTEPLVQVAELDEVIVVADVLGSDTEDLKSGQMALVSEVNAKAAPVEGKIEYVADFVDPVRRTIAVRIRVPNPEHRLRPNAFVQVTFATHTAPAVQVPSEAVVTDDQKSIVFIKTGGSDKNSRLERREVRIGRSRDGKTEILSGLTEGQTFVSRGALLLLNALDIAS